MCYSSSNLNVTVSSVMSASHAVYLDGQRVQVDLLQGLDLHVLDQAAQLGDWNPLRAHSTDSVRSATS